MPIEPWVLLAPAEVGGIAALSGLVVTGSFALVYKVIDVSAKERSEERSVRDKEAEGHRKAVDALRDAMTAMKERR